MFFHCSVVLFYQDRKQAAEAVKEEDKKPGARGHIHSHHDTEDRQTFGQDSHYSRVSGTVGSEAPFHKTQLLPQARLPPAFSNSVLHEKKKKQKNHKRLDWEYLQSTHKRCD